MTRPEPDFLYLNIGDRWPGFDLTNLEIAADGALQLRALPRLVGRLPENLSDLPTPQSPAGIARADDGALFFTDPEQHRLWRIDPGDPAHTPRPAPCLGGEGSEAAHFKSPRGLLFLPGRGLLIADSGNHRLQIVDPLTGQVREIWDGFDDDGDPLLNEPWALAADSDGNVYVVVAGDGSLRRIDRLGRLDAEFEAQIEARAVLTEPVAVAIASIDGEEHVLVLDRALRAVVVYSLAGRWRKTLASDVLQAPLAMGISERALYVGDNGAERQCVLQFDLPRLAHERLNLVGPAVGYQGPVAALFTGRAAGESPAQRVPGSQAEPPGGEQPGDLLLLAGPGVAPVVLKEGAGYDTCGFAVAGPFDRRQPVTWHRLQALAEALPPHTHARFFFFLGEPPGRAGDEIVADWLADVPPTFDPCSALEATLSAWRAFPPDVTDGLFGSFATAPDTGRASLPYAPGDARDDPAKATYLWLGLALSGDGTATPRVHQIRLQFNHEGYLPHLPALYAQDTASRGFLLPTLSLFESFFAEHESLIAGLAALFDPAAAPAESLDWLAGWLAQDLEEEWSADRKRKLITDAFAAYAWRGTAAGLRRRIERLAGIQAHILEPLLYTDLWSLGETSTLGFDTMLASAEPQGAVVGTTAVLDQSHLITQAEFGAPLFEAVAHQFSVQVYQGQVKGTKKLDEISSIIEREKPAHTTYHLCIIEPRMRVGFQARLGIDTIVAGPTPAARLGKTPGSSLDLVTGGEPPGRIGHRSQIGITTRLTGSG